jgi:hypothetical protein
VPTASSWPEGRASAGALSLAIADASEKFAVKLSYVWEEVDCDGMQATSAISRMLQDDIVDAVIGPDCEAACESSAYVTSGRDIAQISYSCSSDLLSNKKQYPTVRPRVFCSSLWHPERPPMLISLVHPLYGLRATQHFDGLFLAFDKSWGDEELRMANLGLAYHVSYLGTSTAPDVIRLRMQPFDFRAQPVATIRKLGASSRNIHMRRTCGDGGNRDGDQDCAR